MCDKAEKADLIPETVPAATSILVPLDSLPASDDLGGKEPDSAFIRAIKRFGVLNPITLVGIPDKFVLAAGRRRIKAARQAGFREIPARLYASDDLSPHVILLVENGARSSNAAAEFLAAVNLLNQGHDIADIQAAVGMGKSTAEKLLRLRSLTPIMLTILGEDRMATDTAFQAAQLSVEEQDSLSRGKETRGRVTGTDVDAILEAKREIVRAKARAEAEAATARAEAARKKEEEAARAKAVEDALVKAKAQAEQEARRAREQAEREQAEAVAAAKREAEAEQERAVAQARTEETTRLREKAATRAELAPRIMAEARGEPDSIEMDALRGGWQQNELVADFIIANCPGEVSNEGAGDLVVRVLARFASNVQAALKELEAVGHSGHRQRVKNAVDFLNAALGKWDRK